ncbi:MAG: hypothetical protein VKN83_01165, partial [Cyanobacteriota bacterium]|nr:hypothetical protein [Cyanobacteriota bacterium]
MSPSLICLDQQHPLKAGIAARFGLGVGSLDEGWQGDGPRLLIAPWWMALPDPWPGSALLRHGPLVSDLRHHDNAISLQRLLLWPYGTAAMAWLADADLLEAIGAWLGDPWEGERWLEG